MGRKVTSGVVGGSGLGSISVVSDTISSQLNDIVKFNSDVQIQATKDLRFADSDNSNWLAFQAPNTVSSNITWTLPSANGTAGQALVIDSGTTLTWGDAGGSVAIGDENAGGAAGSSSTFYPVFVSSSVLTSGQMDAARSASTKMTFVPNTGLLTVTTLTETSSITLKENINPIENALDSLLKLTGVIYDRKDGSRKGEAGLIAEDVEKVIPNVVVKNDNGDPESIQYTKLTAYLIEAVKTLKQEIEILKGSR